MKRHTARLALALGWRGTVAAVAAALTLAGLVSCAHHPIPVSSKLTEGKFYTRHALRGEQAGLQKVVYRSNYLVLPEVIPPASEASIEVYTQLHVDMVVGGIRCRMVHDLDAPFPVNEEGIARFLEKHFTRDPAAVGLDKVSESNRKLIERGEAAVGMTKEEVILALGYPSHVDADRPTADMTREQILQSNLWTYRYQKIVFVPTSYKFTFGSDGKLLQRDPP